MINIKIECSEDITLNDAAKVLAEELSKKNELYDAFVTCIAGGIKGCGVSEMLVLLPFEPEDDTMRRIRRLATAVADRIIGGRRMTNGKIFIVLVYILNIVVVALTGYCNLTANTEITKLSYGCMFCIAMIWMFVSMIGDLEK